MNRPLLLDLFSGAGGAAMGYYNAGFDIIGVDNKPQEHYPFEFVEADALDVLASLGRCWMPEQYENVSVIHASPPCQHWSGLSNSQPGTKEKYPDLITPVRKMLLAAGLPYVIENVPGAPLIYPVMLCGSMFSRRVRLHRMFETSFHVPQPDCHHDGYVINPHNREGRKRMREEFGEDANQAEIWRKAKGVPWMNWDEASDAIIPDYTQFIGLIARVTGRPAGTGGLVWRDAA